MKTFYFKMFVIQTLFYGLLWLMFYTDGLTKYGKIVWKPLLIVFYSLSITITFIIPIIKEFRNK